MRWIAAQNRIGILNFPFIFTYSPMRNRKDSRDVNDYDVIIVSDFPKYPVKNVRHFLKLLLSDFNFQSLYFKNHMQNLQNNILKKIYFQLARTPKYITLKVKLSKLVPVSWCFSVDFLHSISKTRHKSRNQHPETVLAT